MLEQEDNFVLKTNYLVLSKKEWMPPELLLIDFENIGAHPTGQPNDGPSSAS